MAVRPLFDGLGLLPFSILFFVVVVLLTIRPSRLVDIIGKCLTPVLITGILILIVVGIANPIGPIGPAASPNIAQEGCWPDTRPWTFCPWPASPLSFRTPWSSPA